MGTGFDSLLQRPMLERNIFLIKFIVIVVEHE